MGKNSADKTNYGLVIKASGRADERGFSFSGLFLKKSGQKNKNVMCLECKTCRRLTMKTPQEVLSANIACVDCEKTQRVARIEQALKKTTFRAIAVKFENLGTNVSCECSKCGFKIKRRIDELKNVSVCRGCSRIARIEKIKSKLSVLKCRFDKLVDRKVGNQLVHFTYLPSGKAKVCDVNCVLNGQNVARDLAMDHALDSLAKERNGTYEGRAGEGKYSFVCEAGHEFNSHSTAVLKDNSWCRLCSRGLYQRAIHHVVSSKFKKEFTPAWPEFLRNPETNCLLEFDIYNPELGLAIEFDGSQHYDPTNVIVAKKPELLKAIKRRDKIKDRLAKKAGVTLIRIREDELQANWKTLGSLIKEKLIKANYKNIPKNWDKITVNMGPVYSQWLAKHSAAFIKETYGLYWAAIYPVNKAEAARKTAPGSRYPARVT
jgi:hypothetical protein